MLMAPHLHDHYVGYLASVIATATTNRLLLLHDIDTSDTSKSEIDFNNYIKETSKNLNFVIILNT